MKRTKRKALPKNKLGRMLEKLEHLKAGVRAKVEYPVHVITAHHSQLSLEMAGVQLREFTYMAVTRLTALHRKEIMAIRIVA